MTNKERVAAAVAATKEVAGDYWRACLAQRAGDSPGAAGSIYPGLSPEQVEAKLVSAEWEEYSHEAIMAGCVAFKAALPGQLGIVSLLTLPEDTPVVLDDRKNTGKVSATVSGVRGETVQFTVIILGQEQGREVVFTFHPGDPIRPSVVPCKAGLHGKKITIGEAFAMGFAMAKIV